MGIIRPAKFLRTQEVLKKKDNCDNSGDVYYIPYFSVIKKDALTTKLRNVFNASAKSENGVTLNDQIYPGPKMQTTIFDVITRSRQFRFIYGADVPSDFDPS
jgi:hypothetical protein